MKVPNWFDEYEYGRWFSLDKYPSCRDPEYWSGMIYTRLQFLASMARFHDWSQSTKEELFMSWVAGSLRGQWRNLHRPDPRALYELDYITYTVLTTQLLDSAEFADHDRAFREYVELMEQDESHSFELTDYGEQGADLPLEVESELQIMSPDQMRHKPLSAFNTLSPPSRLHIVVNLEQDDASLIEQLRELLHSKREDKKRKVSDADFVRWYAAGVLPCFDLLSWAGIVGHPITNAQLGDLLWPDGDLDRSEKVRKTTKKYTQSVITPAMLKRLGSFPPKQ